MDEILRLHDGVRSGKVQVNGTRGYEMALDLVLGLWLWVFVSCPLSVVMEPPPIQLLTTNYGQLTTDKDLNLKLVNQAMQV